VSRILVVDDREENTYLLSALLAGNGYDVTTARHGAEALVRARQTPPDLVVSDLLMPVMDGYMLLRHWKTDPSLARVPFVVYTATYTSERDEQLALQLGADAFLIKPTEPEVLLERLRSLLRELGEGRRTLNPGQTPDGPALLSQYSGVLIHKLEEKMLALEEANRQLERDLEERRGVEAALRETQAEALEQRAALEALLASIPDEVVYLDADGQICATNRPDRAPVGHVWLAGATPERRVRFERAAKEVVDTGSPVSFEWVEGDENQENQVSWNTLAPVKRPKRIPGLVLVRRDVTARRTSEAQLLVAERMATLGTLAASVAHEINNPLASVSANLALAVHEIEALPPSYPVPQDVRDELRDALDGAERVRVIVRDLRLFARESAERSGPVDVQQILESTLRMARNELRHRATVIREFREVPAVQGNEARLGQVFLNLVINAAQAIPVGRADEGTIRIQTSFDAGLGRVVVAITDNGQGMTDEIKRRLFRPFVTTKAPGEGTGLGLSICRRIMTELGGEIDFISELGRGTTFYVRLPVGGAAAREVVSPAAPGPTGTRRASVLVVDDEEILARTVKRILAPQHDVTVELSAKGALAQVASGRRFDLVLCDVMMPDMTGVELYAALAAQDPALSSRVVFMTGGAFTPTTAAFLADADIARVDKPFTTEAITKVVDERLARFTRR